jgi:integrase/recombinase XerD
MTPLPRESESLLSLSQATSDEHLIALWLHGRSPHTQRAYEADARRFLAFVQKPLRLITLGDLVNFAETLKKLAPTSQYRVLASVKSLFAFGHRIGYLGFDASRVLRLPSARNQLAQRILPEADVHRMLSLEPDERNRALLTLLYASGIRVHELCGLRWRDLEPTSGGGQVTVFGKGSKTRSIRLPVSVWKLVTGLRKGREVGDPVFASRKKGPLGDAQVWRIVRAAGQRAGIELNVSPHWMRHAHASHALDRGAPIHLVQATLGHASVSTTGRYLHARPNDSSSRFLAL